jgi:HK97 family phage prohead protease
MFDFFGTYSEVVSRGAFTKTLSDGADVRLLLNHSGIPLARTKSSTLRLSEDDIGLAVEAELDGASGIVRDIRSAMDRGDLDEMSFMFEVIRQQWSPDYEERRINEVKLYDVSVVTFPANPAATAQMNSAQLSQLEARAARSALAGIREKRALTPEESETLQHVLNLFVAADLAADEGQEIVSNLIGVPNPDADNIIEPTESNEMEPRALSLIRERLARL